MLQRPVASDSDDDSIMQALGGGGVVGVSQSWAGARGVEGRSEGR